MPRMIVITIAMRPEDKEDAEILKKAIERIIEREELDALVSLYDTVVPD